MIGRLYRMTLRLLPRDFRERFGDEMFDAYMARCRDSNSGVVRMRRTVQGLLDVASTAILERRDLQRAPKITATLRTQNRMSSILRDFAYALRALRTQPGFAATVIITLALGIGANTAVFSLIDGVLLRPVAIERAEDVVAVYLAMNEKAPHGDVSFPELAALSNGVRTMQGVAGWHVQDIGFRSDAKVEQVSSIAVTGNYFAMLGVRSKAGRTLAPGDDRVEAPRVAMLSESMVRRYFRSNAEALGRIVYLGGNAFTVVGVVPSQFHGLRVGRAPDVWVPLRQITEIGAGGLFSGKVAPQVFTTPHLRWVTVFGRLRDGVSAETATSELNLLHGRFAESIQQSSGPRIEKPISVVTINTAAALRDRESLIRFVRVLLAVVGLTLLIACFNIANLMLVRGARRMREMNIRAAIGATRSNLIRQLAIESLVLGCAGALAGSVVATATMKLLSQFTLPGEVSLSELQLVPDGRVMVFTLIVTVLTTTIFGLLPAFRASRADGATLIRAQGTMARHGPRGVLVAAQVAMCITLLIGAGLFLRSLRAGLNTDIGFDAQPLAAATVKLRLHGYTNDRASIFYDEVMRRLNGTPGIIEAGVGVHVPLAPMTSLPFSRDDGALPGNQKSVLAGMNPISANYFNVMGMKMVAGRTFETQDGPASSKVAIVNEAAIRLFWGEGSPLGRSITLFGGIRYTIVGVVRDAKYESVHDQGVPVVFVPLAQEPGLGITSVIVRSTNPEAARRLLLSQISAVDPLLPVSDVRLVSDQLDLVLMPQRFGAVLLVAFGVVALAVSAVGIYGVVSYAANERTQEIGVRIALGARARDIVQLVALRSGVAIVGGLFAGVGAALFGTRALEQFLLGVEAIDPASFAMAVALLVLTAIVAAWLPARRAVRTNPATTIREG